MYKALDIAKYIVQKCIDEKDPISNLQLQKILYFIQVYYLRNKNTPLFNDDFEAWQFGPVIPKVYTQYSMYGAGKIGHLYGQEILKGEEIAIEDQRNIDLITEEKRTLSPWDLVEDTHDKTKAWYYVYSRLGKRAPITKSLMRERG